MPPQVQSWYFVEKHSVFIPGCITTRSELSLIDIQINAKQAMNGHRAVGPAWMFQ